MISSLYAAMKITLITVTPYQRTVVMKTAWNYWWQQCTEDWSLFMHTDIWASYLMYSWYTNTNRIHEIIKIKWTETITYTNLNNLTISNLLRQFNTMREILIHCTITLRDKLPKSNSGNAEMKTLKMERKIPCCNFMLKTLLHYLIKTNKPNYWYQ